MKVQEVKRQVQLREWASQIKAREESGMTVRAWCRESGISHKTYYSRLKRVREELLEAMGIEVAPQTGLATVGESRFQQRESAVFAPVAMPQGKGASITVWIGSYAIDIQNGADSETIEQALKAVSRL
jgi:lambda repressor-like predicted transcriptional regulator